MSEPDHYDILLAEIEARILAAKQAGNRVNQRMAAMGFYAVGESGEPIDRVAQRNAENRAALLSNEARREET